MKIILDTANIEKIESCWENYPVYGVTTNPSILAREGRNPYETLRAIRSIIGNKDLHVETLGRTKDEILSEAKNIVFNLGEDTFIKIPVTSEGVKAIKELKEAGIRTTATAVFSFSQAMIASLSGASFIAPYVNRIDNLGGNGTETAIEIEKAFVQNGMSTHVIGASFKSIKQIETLLKGGAWGVTISPELLESMVKHPGTDDAVKKFEEDWAKLDCGPLL